MVLRNKKRKIQIFEVQLLVMLVKEVMFSSASVVCSYDYANLFSQNSVERQQLVVEETIRFDGNLDPVTLGLGWLGLDYSSVRWGQVILRIIVTFLRDYGYTVMSMILYTCR